MRRAVYPGSFDPLTNGHLGILKRALAVFDEVVLLLAVNPAKKSTFTVEERLEMMKEATADIKGVTVDFYDGLTVDYCHKVGAKHLIRGLRAVTDFENEFQLFSANRYIASDVDMVFLMADPAHTFLSSSVVRELWKNGADITPLVPPSVKKAYEKKVK